MNGKKFILHFQQYMFYYVIAFILLIVIHVVAIRFVNDHFENQRSNSDFSSYEEAVRSAYAINPALFKFNKEGIAIVKVDDLMGEITNGKDTQIGIGIIPVDEKQNQCVGYFIVTKKNNQKIEIDTSHFCDMIDY